MQPYKKQDKIRKLDEICVMGSEKTLEFAITLYGIVYCGIRPTEHEVDCKYRAKNEDHNGLYRCDCSLAKWMI